MIAEIEYHHEQRDLSNLNLFLKHPSAPKIIGWLPPDYNNVIAEDAHDEHDLDDDDEDSLDTLVKHQHEMNLAQQEAELPAPQSQDGLHDDTVVVVVVEDNDKDDDGDDESLSCMNRNARYSTKSNKGKRPVSRQARRKKRRAFGNHRR